MNVFGRGNRRKRPERRLPLPRVDWVRVLGVAGACLALAVLYSGARWVLDRPVERVVVNGQFERVSADQIEAVMRTHMGEGFLAADLATIQRELADLQWVATAQVSRRWPDALEVIVTEEEPAARWGEDGLLNPRGRLFVRHASHIPAELPRLSGPEGSEAEVAARYVVIQEQLVQRGLSVVSLEYDGRGAWAFLISNGIQVRLGSLQVDQRLGRFYRALDEVVGPIAEDVAYVDMRYTNGFSIGWKQQRAARSGAATAEESGADAQEG